MLKISLAAATGGYEHSEGKWETDMRISYSTYLNKIHGGWVGKAGLP